MRDLNTLDVNSVNLRNFFADSLKRSGEKNVIQAPVTFNKGFNAKSLTVNSLVNGVDISKAIPITGGREVHLQGALKFHKISASKINANLVNGVDIHNVSVET